MREFSEAEWRNDPATASAEADASPVAILHDGQPRYVLMTIERYRRMQRLDPRRVYRTDEAPPEITAEALTAIEALLSDDAQREADAPHA